MPLLLVSSPLSHNLEFKVRCPAGELARVEARALAAGVDSFQRLRHRDDYFVAASGRLKQREIVDDAGTASAELIAYARPDAAGARWSAYRRVPLPAEVAASTRDALAMALGLLAVVEKERRVAILRRTRIHLDRVADLGEFVELETVVDRADDPTAAAELAEIAALLGLDGCETIAGSYADLAIAARERGEEKEGLS